MIPRARLPGRLLLIVALVAGCRGGPIDASAALPSPGSSVPAFRYTQLDGRAVIAETDLRQRPTVLALWSIHCPFQGPAMAAFDSLAKQYSGRGVRFVLLADDPPSPALDSALQAATWRASAQTIGIASGTLAKTFDQSDRVKSPARIEFVLPSFLLVDAGGRVAARAFGLTVDTFSGTLDSLLASSR